MILRKPYALLIKYFQIIHVILTFLMIYLIIKVNTLVNFFREFIKSGYSINNIAGTHVTIIMYLIVIMILLIGITIYLLMRTKDKPTRYYMYLILYYIFLFISFSVAHGVLVAFETTLIDAQTARFYQDISLLISLPQYIFVIIAGLRATGFNIRKFNFSKDLQDLKIEEKDNEEFEVAFDNESYKWKRSLRRSIREIRYYVFEFKFILICISIICISVFGTIIYLNLAVFNRTYKIDQSFVAGNIRLKIGESYLTNRSFDGSIMPNGKYYLVVNITLQNLVKARQKVNLENFRLMLSNVKIPTVERNEHFVDLGIPYGNEKIIFEEETPRLLIYELNEDEVHNEYTLRILNNITYKAGDIMARYSQSTLKPKVIADIDTNPANLNEEILLKGTYLGDSKLNINSYQIVNSFKFSYDFCVKDNCQKSYNIIYPSPSDYNKILLLINGEFSFDKNTFIYKSAKTENTLIPLVFQIRYTINNLQRTLKLKNVTPSTINNQFVFEVHNGIEKADSVSLVISLRDKEYIVPLK